MTHETLALLRHSLRTPLNHILGYAEIAREHPAGREDAATVALLDSIAASAREIEGLIRSELRTRADAAEDVSAFRSGMRPALEQILSSVTALESAEYGADFAGDVAKVRSAAQELATVSTMRSPALSGQALSLPQYPGTERPESSLKGRILLVDDDEANRELLCRGLEREGFQVSSESGGHDALTRLKRESFDLLLLDILMPGMDGFEVLARIRENNDLKELPVVALSALDDLDSAMRALSMGADDFLVKPFDPLLLRVRIGALLRRRQAEIERTRMAENLALLLESTGEGIYGLNREGCCTFINRAALEMLRYPAGELLGRDLHPVIHHTRADGSPYPEEECPATTVLATGEPRQGSSELMFRSDGSSFPVHYTAHAMRRDGSVEGVVVTFSDITERKRTEERLLQSAKLESLGVMAGGIAHDFNNILTGILGNASLVLETMPRSDGNREFLEEVVTASERAADLTRQMLAFAGKGQFLVELVDLSEMVREITELLEATLPKTVRLAMQLGRNLPMVEGDRRQLQQLVFNLVSNAGEAIGDRPGTVEVGARSVELRDPRPSSFERLEPGRYVCLSVKDDGDGMNESVRARIFDPFFTTKFTGRGLGLPAAIGIVQSHHGAVRVDSAPGAGSTFEVLLPPAKAKPHQEKAILVVDDEEIVRRATRSILERKGYRVLIAEHGRTAVEMFRREPESIGLILLDVTMPVMGGEDAAKLLRAIRPDVPIIVSSGYQESDVARRFGGHRISAFLRKPYTASTLLDKIASAMGSRTD
jgi:PAS domain S-box-containing protein